MLILASLVFGLHCVLLRNKAGVYCLPFVCVGFGGKRVIVVPHSLIQRWLALLYYLYYLRLAALSKS